MNNCGKFGGWACSNSAEEVENVKSLRHTDKKSSAELPSMYGPNNLSEFEIIRFNCTFSTTLGRCSDCLDTIT